MVSQHGLKLAVGLITSHFGDLVGKVCECLLRRGTLSLHEIIRFTEISSPQVKNSLLVLIQHSCVQAFSVPRPATSGTEIRTVTQYMALVDNILHRLRFSKFLSIVQADLGLQCRNLLEGLLQHGRLTYEQLAEREVSTKRLGGSTSNQNTLRVEFDRLVHAHYVERCPRPEPFISSPAEDKLTSTKRRGAKADAVNLSVEELAMIGAALPVTERFSAIGSTGEDEESKTHGHNSYISVGDKRKHEAIIEKESHSAFVESGVLWRVNFEKFVYCLKKKACVANVRLRLGLDFAIVLEAMIESNTLEGNKNSVQASIENIIEAVRGKPGGIRMTLDHVRAALEKLNSSISSKESGVLYEIDLKVIIRLCRTEEVEALLLKKYGEVAHRIFRFLTKEGVQETDYISGRTLMEKKATQGTLVKLWKDEFLEVKKVVSHGSGPTQHFLWGVNWDYLCLHVLDDMYHAALNLSQKIAHILAQEQEALQDKAKRQRLQKGRLILESSLLKLDDVLMLFHDF